MQIVITNLVNLQGNYKFLIFVYKFKCESLLSCSHDNGFHLIQLKECIIHSKFLNLEIYIEPEFLFCVIIYERNRKTTSTYPKLL